MHKIMRERSSHDLMHFLAIHAYISSVKWICRYDEQWFDHESMMVEPLKGGFLDAAF